VAFNCLTLLSAPGRVMTPRSSTERLAAAACARLGGRSARIADVGTGSGAIAVAAACPNVEACSTDGLDPYRRLIDTAKTWLADDGALLLQLHRRVISAPRAELPDLREALDGAPTALAA
jgi:methylase of polypeptide subunit release factors